MQNALINSPLVSVIIPCRNEGDHIANCLSSIFDQDEVPGGFEVIVADGMSNDGTRKILKRLSQKDSRLTVVDNPGGIVSTGLNAAIKKASGSIIIRMDAHTTYAADYIYQCVSVLDQTQANNVGGAARTMSSGYVQCAIAAAYHSVFSAGGARFHNPDYEGYVDTVTYGCWRREVFDRIGVFDEELVRNQDDEFNLRLVRSGGKIWQSVKIKSWYHPRKSLRHLFFQYLQYGYWKARVVQKHCLPASVRHLIPSAFVFTLVFLPLLSLIWPVAFWAWVSALGLYVAIDIFFSVITAKSNGWSLFPILPCVFAIFHVAYGWGFLKGVVNFMILRRKATQSYSALTRSSSDPLVH